MAEQRTLASGARAFRLSIAGTEHVCDVRPGETILKAGLRDNIKIAHLCLVGDCGSCRSQLVAGRVQLKRDISNHISSDELQAGFVLACQCVPQSDVELIVPGVSPITAKPTRCIRSKGVSKARGFSITTSANS
ncbi:2Fe-2S iron-sulfur cluster-binding protein [Caballeronia humi]|uniref:Oxidoreductase n=1 Tax=Caballeronia humi TaxID=326474 RepID=A0A158IA60_9BURK|nr:2Fe-2S iron-sulfur cluster-binding protein [Caballeronia humi]SAL53454.1 oxidoreductase [Caballeronia humi]